MVLAGHASSVAHSTAEVAAAGAGELGWWVLVLAIGLGTAAVLSIVVALDRVAAASEARRRRRGQDLTPGGQPIFRLPPPAGVVTAAVAAPGRVVTEQVETLHRRPEAGSTPPRPAPPAPAPAPQVTRSPRRPAAHTRQPRVRLPRPHLPRPRLRLPAVPRPSVPRPGIPLPGTSSRTATPPAGPPAGPARPLPTDRPAGRPRVRRPNVVVSKPARPSRPSVGRRARDTWAGTGASVVRVLATAAVPVALGVRIATDPGWLADGGAAAVAATVVALVLAGAGLRWLRQATQRPRALRRTTRELLVAAEELRLARVEAARRLLAEVDDDGGPPAVWAAFGREIGLHVPPRMRSLISRQMDPEALVRYLGAQTLEPEVAERPAWVVVAVPTVCLLLPAVLVILLV